MDQKIRNKIPILIILRTEKKNSESFQIFELTKNQKSNIENA